MIFPFAQMKIVNRALKCKITGNYMDTLLKVEFN